MRQFAHKRNQKFNLITNAIVLEKVCGESPTIEYRPKAGGTKNAEVVFIYGFEPDTKRGKVVDFSNHREVTVHNAKRNDNGNVTTSSVTTLSYKGDGKNVYLSGQWQYGPDWTVAELTLIPYLWFTGNASTRKLVETWGTNHDYQINHKFISSNKEEDKEFKRTRNTEDLEIVHRTENVRHFYDRQYISAVIYYFDERPNYKTRGGSAAVLNSVCNYISEHFDMLLDYKDKIIDMLFKNKIIVPIIKTAT